MGFETVPVFVCLMMALPHPFEEGGRVLHTNAEFLTVVTVKKINMIKRLICSSYAWAQNVLSFTKVSVFSVN